MIRLFVAINLPGTVLEKLDRVVQSLRPEARIRWSPIENFHITTKFIGAWSEERLDELRAALDAVPSREPFDVRVSHLGWFPNADKPRVLWAGVDGGESLTGLAANTDERLGALGISREDRPYRPHLTLARMKAEISLGQLPRRVAEEKNADFGSFTAASFTLYQSDPGPNGSVYRPLHRFAFQSAAN